MKNYLKSISKYFKKEKIDWLDEQPYLGKYLIYKIKRIIMNLIYNIWEGIDKYVLEQYFAEINFTNEDKVYDAYMAFIILSRNREEALDVLRQINTELNSRFNLNVAPIILSEKIVTVDLLESIKEKILSGAEGHIKGKVIFKTFRGLKIVPEQLKYLDDETQETAMPGNFTKLTKDFKFNIIRAKKSALVQNEEYSVTIKVFEEEIKKQESTGTLEEIKNLMDKTNKPQN